MRAVTPRKKVDIKGKYTDIITDIRCTDQNLFQTFKLISNPFHEGVAEGSPSSCCMPTVFCDCEAQIVEHVIPS